jgi:hypothetical protein
VRAANDVLRFALELSMLGALGYAGYELAGGGAAGVVAALAAPVAAAALWGTLLAPKSSRRVRDPRRLVAELCLFGAAVAGLAAAGSVALAVVLGAAVAAHIALTFALGQRT